MPETPSTPPKAFISYSWSNSEHVARVIDLATDLREAGVDAILDKWDLREGQETSAFMEKMVTDKTITKVIIVSDRIYSEKSDNRSGGAGTEAQIISPKLYANEEEGKFVALVFERDERGKEYLPVFYTSRIFIDFTDPARISDNFEQLVRWIYDKPLHKKPDIGKPPAYLIDGEATIKMGTGAAYRRAIDAIDNSKPHVFAALQEYFNTLTDQLDNFRIDVDTDPLSNEILENYKSFIPYRDEIVSLTRSMARTNPDPRYGHALHAFLERFIPYFHPTPEKGRYRQFDFDNYKFFAHELMLYFCTVALQEKRLDIIDDLLGRPYYYYEGSDRSGNLIDDYDAFAHYDDLLENRNKSLNMGRVSLQADLLKERSAGSGFRFDQLQQTDFILYLRHMLIRKSQFSGWYPITLSILTYGNKTFELFMRAQSKRELTYLLSVLGIKEIDSLNSLIDQFRDGSIRQLKFDNVRYRLDVLRLAGYPNLGSIP